MPLIDLKTNLKSLKFGKDRPGGGSSNQPYIQKEIPEGGPSNIFNTGGPIAPLMAANDTSRLSQMFFDLKSPNGLLFTATQNVLSRTAVKTEASEGPGYGGGNVNAGIYTPLNTITQAGSGFLGTHLNFLGLDPTGLSDAGLNNYFDVVKNQEVENNRLINLTSNEDPVNILQYDGGPGSILGVGQTSIKYADQRTGANNPQSVTNPTSFYTGSRWNAKTQDNWVSPVTKGASGKYEDYTNQPGSLLFQDGAPILSPDGGYTYEPTWDIRTTKPNSLEPVDKPNQGFFRVTQTPNFNNYLGASLSEDLTESQKAINSEGQMIGFFGQIGYNSTLSKTNPTNQPLSGSGAYQSVHALPEVNLSNLLGASIKEGIDLTQNGINTEGQFTTKYYGRIGENSTLSKLNPTSKPLSGNNAYLAGLGNSTTNRTGLFMGNLDYAKLTRNGSSQTYIDLVKSFYTGSGEIINNDFYQGDSFNVYTQGGTFPENSALQSGLDNSSSTWTQTEIINATPVSRGGTEGDFRYPLTKDSTVSTITSKGYSPEVYSKIEKDVRLNQGDPGSKSRNRLTYSVTGQALDKINASSIYSAAGPNHSGDKNDLVKFSIGILNTSGTSNFMNFRAYIDSFSDQYTADWGDTQYIGRADKFFNYKGFERTISMGWTVYAQSKAELIPMYKKLNYLASSLAPTYSSGGYMQGNLARLTVGGYLYNQLGIIRGFTYDVPKESPWEIGITEEGGLDSTVKELPFMINITGFQFTPIQDFVPQKAKFGENNAQTARYIALSNGENNNYD